MEHSMNTGWQTVTARNGVDMRNQDLTTLSQGNMG